MSDAQTAEREALQAQSVHRLEKEVARLERTNKLLEAERAALAYRLGKAAPDGSAYQAVVERCAELEAALAVATTRIESLEAERSGKPVNGEGSAQP